MPRRLFLLGILSGLLLWPALLAADEDVLVPLEVKVLAAADDTPIGNASVYVRFKEGRWLLKDKKRNWHVKTNHEGMARLPGVPPGKVLIQVVAEGWKTYGKYYEISEENPEQKMQVIEIKLDRPRRWY
ncbi:MAG: carboxypeptidase regulatory-like domain-containing protein [Acidobacteria bacterium]|nr:carboxypeptidase regulatory-like domain-containing protein [Acidobacteriota bacterium]